MAHITRKELKKDEIAETLAHGAEAVLTHQRMLWILGGAVLAVALAVLGWRFYSERQTLKATAALDEAMRVFQARIRAPGESEMPGEVTYLDEKNKFQDAAKKFADVASKYSHTRPGLLARYYAGLSEERLGRYPEAEQSLREAERSGDTELTGLARFQLAQVEQQLGKGDEAVRLFQQLIAKPTTLVPKPFVLLTLADYYSRRNPAEAAKLYNQIKTEFPDSPLAEEATQRLELLGPKA